MYQSICLLWIRGKIVLLPGFLFGLEKQETFAESHLRRSRTGNVFTKIIHSLVRDVKAEKVNT